MGLAVKSFTAEDAENAEIRGGLEISPSKRFTIRWIPSFK